MREDLTDAHKQQMHRPAWLKGTDQTVQMLSEHLHSLISPFVICYLERQESNLLHAKFQYSS